jgi:uncharacterized protein YecE (DUF72 family)
MIRIGTAAWAIRREHADRFLATGSQLARYAAHFNAAEINSSFHRPHRAATYARWARETPRGFAFSVKMPRAISHETRLAGARDLLRRFLGECSALGGKLGCILVQLPPSLGFDADIAQRFFADLRTLYPGPVACEPRHASWFDAETTLLRYRIARVAADPLPKSVPASAAVPGGFAGFAYWRLHGSPRIYHSNYEEDFLRTLRLRDGDWCIFDNTARGFATTNALWLAHHLSDMQDRPASSLAISET